MASMLSVKDGNSFLNLSNLMEIALSRNPFCCAKSDDRTISLQSKYTKRWQEYVALIITLTVCLEFIMLAFRTGSWLMTAVTLCDLIFAIDVALRFYTSYYDSKGVEISDRRMVVCHNLMTSFTIDALSLLPLSQIEYFFVEPDSISAVLMFFIRLNKLMRFYRVLVLFNSKEATIGSNLVSIRSLKYALVCFLSVIILCCIWFSFSCDRFTTSSDVVCDNQTWANNEKYVLEVYAANEGLATLQAGVAAVYWIVASTTSVGYGDVTAVNLGEKVFSCITMLIGICVFMAMALGGMAAIVTTFDQQRANYLHKYNIIVKTLTERDCDEDLKKQAIGFYEYLWRRRRGETTTDIYKGLPFNFVAEISYATHKTLLEKAHLFDDVGSGFLRMVSLLIHPVLFLPQQIVAAKGDVVHHMFYILNGELEVLSEEDDDTPILTLKSGKLFGELSMMYSLQRTATIRAVTHCDLMCLERRDLHNLLKQYPDISKKLHDRAKERCEKALNLPAKKQPQFEAYQSRCSSYIEPSHLGGLRRSFAAIDPSESHLSHFSVISHQSFRSKVHPQNLELPGHPSRQSRLHVSSSLYHRQRLKSVCSIGSSVDVIDEAEEEEELQQSRTTLFMLWQRLCLCFKWLSSITISPESGFLHFWEKIVLFIALLQAFVCPYMACFRVYNTVSDLPHSTTWIVFFTLTYICDFIFVLDAAVNLRTGIATPHGTLTEFKDIVKHYCKSRHFVFDILCVVPLECTAPFISNTSIHMRVFGFLRLNRIIKVLELPKMFDRREERLEGQVLLTRSIKLLCYVLIVLHWMACSLYVVACPIDECVEGSWILVYKERLSLTDVSAVTEYIMTLYFAAATLTSTGYGDISAHTTWLRVLAAFLMLLGLFLFGYCLSVQAATLANVDAPRVRYYEKYFAIKDYMESHHIEADLQERITNYLKIQWKKYGGIWIPGQKSIMDDIPVTLMEDIVMEDYFWMFSQCPVFQELDESFIRMLSLKLVSYTFSPGDVIVYAGDFGKEMYMIRRGVCQYVTPNKGVVLADLSRGQYFGDLSMLYKDYQMGTVRASSHVEVLELRLTDFEEVVKEFPLIQAQFKTLMADKDRWLQIKAGLNEEIDRVESEAVYSDTSVTILSGTSTLLDRMRRKSQQPNMKVFGERTEDGDPDTDYTKPFEHLEPFYRLLANCLMKRTFLPAGKALTWWLRIQLLIACVEVMIVPFQAAFMFHNPFFHTIQYSVDFVALISLYLGLHMAFYDEEGVLVTHPIYTAKQYLITNFTIDLLGCFPFELILLMVYHDSSSEILHIVSLLRLTRLLQLYRLPLAFSTYESRIDKAIERIKTLKFFIYVLIFNNFLTCCLYLMACPPKLLVDAIGDIEVYHNKRGDQCINGSWISSAENTVSVSMMYTVTLYWAVATSVSVGYGDISAHSNVEMIVSLIVMISGVLFYGYIIASIAASLANADTQRAEYHGKMDAVKRFMSEHDVWLPLQKKVINYYDYIWQRTRGIDPKTLFEGLPLALWEDITCSLYQETLSMISWFKDTEKSFLKTLSRYVKAVIFRKGDYICRKSDVGIEVFFIKRGVVDVVSEDGNVVFESLTAGQSFGEDAWLFKCTRPASIRARTNCDLFMLTKDDLDFVLESYPYLKGKITKIAKAELSKAQVITESTKLLEKFSTVNERKEMSHAFRSVRLEDLKRVDPESGLSDADLMEPPITTTIKAKPRMSLAGGSLSGNEAFSMPPGLKQLQKRMSTMPTADLDDDDSLSTESSGMIVPAVTCRKKSSKTVSRTNSITSRSISDISGNGDPQNSSLSTESSGMIVPAVTCRKKSSKTVSRTNSRTSRSILDISGNDDPQNPSNKELSLNTDRVCSGMEGTSGSDNNEMHIGKNTSDVIDSINVGISDARNVSNLSQNDIRQMSTRRSSDIVDIRSSSLLETRNRSAGHQTSVSGISRANMSGSSSNDTDEFGMHQVERKKSSLDVSVTSQLSIGLDPEESKSDILGENANQNNLGADSAQSIVDEPAAPNTAWESNFSLAAPSHASILCSGVHLPQETDEFTEQGCLYQLQNFHVHPQSWFYWIFSELMCLFGFLSGWLIIYQAAFQDHNVIVLTLNYLIDVVYLIQIFIKFHLIYYDENGDLVDDLSEIRRHYTQSKFNFAVDIFSVAPLEFLALAAPPGSKMIALSIFRLLRLSRLSRLYQYFTELEQQLNANMLLVRLCKFVVFVTLAVHFFSCLWYLVACPFGECTTNSWIGQTTFEGNLEAYVTSMYWCLATVTSTGYGDISPRTEIEVWVSIVTMVFGKFMFGIVLANIASTLANSEAERVNFDDKHQALMSHMSDQDVPKPLQQRVSDYFNFMWHRNRGREVKNLFIDTPNAMRAEILLNVTRDMLESIPFFEHADDNFLCQMAQKVDKIMFLPGDFIAIKGDMGREMYFIHRGEVEVVNEEDDSSQEPIILSRGDIIGEVSLVYCVPRRVTLRAVTYVDLFSLSKAGMDEVLEIFPEMKSEIQSQAQQRFHHIIDAMKRAK